MNSLLLAFCSAVLLGFYDIAKKESLHHNAVLPTLFFATLSGGLLFLIPLVLSRLFPEHMQSIHAFIPEVNGYAHLLFFIKTIIVFISWLTAYFAMRHLPLTITSPIRCSNPVWTLIGALLLFKETITSIQWVGILLIMLFYYIFSLAGQKEGISFHRNRWVVLMVISTVMGSVSSLYDKFLVMHYNRLAMQAWYSIYMIPLSGLTTFFFWYRKKTHMPSFYWRKSIPLIGLLLAIADYIYFLAIDMPDSSIALISVLRRSSVIVAFAYGTIIFKEKNSMLKIIAVAGILGSVFILLTG